MSTLSQRWLQRPQSVWLRRVVFQIHLWTGLAIGLYIVVISISGSALVFRERIFKALGEKPQTVLISGPRLTDTQLRQAAESVYPGYHSGYVFRGKRPDQAFIVVLDRNGKYKQELFDPYTGRHLGPAQPPVLSALTWLADLHINLLAGEEGRRWNGYGAILTTVMCFTGAVIWWPGAASWRRSLAARPSRNWKRFNWEVHSMIGFWTFLFTLMWGITGIYVVFPSPFQRVVALFLTPDLFNPRNSPDERFLRWFSLIHFGNFGPGEWRLRALWVILGFAPPFLFLTGALMWWNRVVQPKFAIRFRHLTTSPGSEIITAQLSENLRVGNPKE